MNDSSRYRDETFPSRPHKYLKRTLDSSTGIAQNFDVILKLRALQRLLPLLSQNGKDDLDGQSRFGSLRH